MLTLPSTSVRFAVWPGFPRPYQYSSDLEYCSPREELPLTKSRRKNQREANHKRSLSATWPNFQIAVRILCGGEIRVTRLLILTGQTDQKLTVTVHWAETKGCAQECTEVMSQEKMWSVEMFTEKGTRGHATPTFNHRHGNSRQAFSSFLSLLYFPFFLSLGVGLAST